jgi:hypothetical protein
VEPNAESFQSRTPRTLSEAQLLAQGAATSEWLAIRSIIDDFLAKVSPDGEGFAALAAEEGEGPRFSYDPYEAVSRLSPDTYTGAWEPRASWVLGRLFRLSGYSIAWIRTRRVFTLTPPRTLSEAQPPAQVVAASNAASDAEERAKRHREATRKKAARGRAERHREDARAQAKIERHREGAREQVKLTRLIRETFVMISAGW